MSRISQILQYITKSRFVRSIFTQIVAVFLTVIVLLIAIVSYSFRSEINKSIVSDKEKQLDTIVDALSSRMEEVTSIAYNIGEDSTFFLNPVAGIKYSGYEMSNTLSRYLVGNRFGLSTVNRTKKIRCVSSGTRRVSGIRVWREAGCS